MTSTIDQRRLLGTVLIATFIGQFDFFVVNVAAPDIQTSLGAGNTALELVVAGYAFMYAAGLVTGGRLGDLLGRRRVFIAGLTAFAVTSALCGLAPNAGVLIACRAMQGLSAAVMLPQVLAFINTVVAPERRGWAMGWFGVASGVGSIAGQGLGGFLVQANPWGLGWRLIFLVNVPIMLIAIIASLRYLPPVSSRGENSVDGIGALAVFVGVAGLMGAALLAQYQRPRIAVASGVLGLIVLAVTIRSQASRVAKELPVTLNPRLFLVRSMRLGSVASGAFMAYFASFMFVLTVVLQRYCDLTPIQAGLVFVPSGATFMISSLAGSSQVRKHLRGSLMLGCGITSIGLGVIVVAILAGSSASTLPWWLVVAVSLTGFGNGLILPTLTGLSLSEVAPKQAGMASGVVTTLQQFGASLGVVIVGAIFYSFATKSMINGMTASTIIHILLVALVGFTCWRATIKQEATAR